MRNLWLILSISITIIRTWLTRTLKNFPSNIKPTTCTTTIRLKSYKRSMKEIIMRNRNFLISKSVKNFSSCNSSWRVITIVISLMKAMPLPLTLLKVYSTNWLINTFKAILSNTIIIQLRNQTNSLKLVKKVGSTLMMSKIHLLCLVLRISIKFYKLCSKSVSQLRISASLIFNIVPSAMSSINSSCLISTLNQLWLTI